MLPQKILEILTPEILRLSGNIVWAYPVHHGWRYRGAWGLELPPHNYYHMPILQHCDIIIFCPMFVSAQVKIANKSAMI